MIKLEDIRQGMQLTGLNGPEAVDVLIAHMLEDIALEIEYKMVAGDFRSSVL